MSKQSRSFIALCTTLLLTILTACGGAPAAEVSVTPISIQLSWEQTIEFTGFQIAKSDGLYQAAGLEVELKPAFNAEDEFVPSIPAVLAGEADFGIGSSYNLMAARAEGKPVVAIAAIYQRSPIGIISLAEKGIVTPQDLIGKTIGASGATSVYIRALLKNLGIADDAVNIVAQTDFSTGALTNGVYDAMGAYITNQPTVFNQEGLDYNLIVLADYAVDGYSNVIFTSEDTIKNRPDVVEKFLRATFGGFQAGLDSPEKAATLSLEYNAELQYENELANMLISVPLLHPSDSQIGMMKPELWALGYSILQDAEVLTAEFDVTQVYTLSFLNKIYGQ